MVEREHGIGEIELAVIVAVEVRNSGTETVLLADMRDVLGTTQWAQRDVVLFGRETIYRDGERVGWLSSAGWGYTLKTNIGLGYVRNQAGVDAEYLKSGSYELEVAGERLPCALQLQPLYDPDMSKMKV